MEKTLNRIKSLRLDIDLILKIEEKAKEENRNFNNMVETILKKALT